MFENPKIVYRSVCTGVDIFREKLENKMKTVVENESYKYRISIVSAVYHAEPFLTEFFSSIFHQTIGFQQHVQLILVDDGSPDASGDICDSYAEKYPDNIIVLHQKNQGVAAARNAGLAYIEGEYVNFCDPDDKLSPDTLRLVYNFFKAHDDETDIVTIPMIMFGTSTGPHHLNDKFSKGTRVINVEKEYTYPLVSIGPTFVRHQAAKTIHFNSELATAEDAEQITKLLIKKHYMGVVADCVYYYRRYGNSLVSSAPSKKEWYSGYLRHFSLEVLRAAEETYGYIPRFVQNTVMSDLQWKFKMPEVPDVLTPEEVDEYKLLLAECISKIDDDVIMCQRSISIDIKLALLAQKNGEENILSPAEHNYYYASDLRLYHTYSKSKTEWSFMDVGKENITLSIRQVFVCIGEQPEEIYLTLNDEYLPAAEQSVAIHQKSIGDVVSHYLIGKFVIPRRQLSEKTNCLKVYTVLGGRHIRSENITCGLFFPLSTRYRFSHCSLDGFLFYWDKAFSLCITTDERQIKNYEKNFRKELKASKNTGAKKASYVRKLLKIFKKFQKKPIWIISDRLTKAGDNGEAFFRYLKSINFGGAKYYYAINKGPDYQKLKKLGNIIDHSSKRYKFLFLACDKFISSHADDNVLNPFLNYSHIYQDILRVKDFIFLQHGITQNDISGWLNRYNKNIKGFVCAARPERDSILNTPTYFYGEKEVWLTGFARFDRLYRDEKRYISIMPTWRRYLMGRMDNTTGTWAPGESFCKSNYYQFYNTLINDERLIKAAKKYGYTICYMPHPTVMTTVDVFDHHPDVHFFGLTDEYRDVYAHSDLILTDYSSAVFDFAYLRKPVVYAQFDYDEFFHGDHVCTPGYFNYKENGFGEVTENMESTIDVLIDYMKNGCKLKQMYRERIDQFFAFSDQNNCKRILDRILEMDNEGQ